MEKMKEPPISLKKWLKDNKKIMADLVIEGLSYPTIYNIYHGKPVRQKSHDLIVKLTNGAVRPAVIYQGFNIPKGDKPITDLQKLIYDKKISYKDFGRKIGVTPEELSRAARGFPVLAGYAKKIKEHTGIEVEVLPPKQREITHRYDMSKNHDKKIELAWAVLKAFEVEPSREWKSYLVVERVEKYQRELLDAARLLAENGLVYIATKRVGDITHYQIKTSTKTIKTNNYFDRIAPWANS